MSSNEIKKNIIEYPTKRELLKVEEFLKTQGLSLDKRIDYTVTLEEDGNIVATGSFGNNVLKCIAINPELRGMGISNTIISELINEEYRRGNSNLFVFTKPENEGLFNQLGFYTLEKAPKVVLLENDKYGIKRYCNKLIDESIEFDYNSRKYEKVAGIVVNCNPFTLGHRYLIEKASKENDLVHLFVLAEDESIFPADVRFDLVKKGIEGLDNVVLHKAVDYIISSATFPSYFLKTENDILTSQAQLDASIFSKHIAKALNIKKRYVGNEPFCKVTSEYNRVLKETLPSYGIELVKIERKKIDDTIISASKVRELLKCGDLENAKKLIPNSTYEFLTSERGQEIISKIRNL